MKEICVLPDSVFRHFEEARSHSVTSMSSTYRCVRTISKMAACVVVGNACCMLQYMKLFRISPNIHKTKIIIIFIQGAHITVVFFKMAL